MILPDVNLLVFAYNRGAPHHEQARIWWERRLSDGTAVRIPWAVCTGFVRLMTHHRVLTTPMGHGQALAVVDDWLKRRHVSTVVPGPDHLEVMSRLFDALGVAGSMTTDVHLAAMAIEHELVLCSNDRGFGRMPGVVWRDPLAD